MSQSLDQVAIQEFCPNPDCPWHQKDKIPPGVKWYRLHGYYESEQHGKIRRYRCLKCRKTFSDRTFDKESYYLHYDDIDILELGRSWLEGEALGEIAKRHGITVNMVRLRLRRLGLNATE